MRNQEANLTTSSRHNAVRFDQADTVAVCLLSLVEGESVRYEGGSVVALEGVPAGHKVALHTIRQAEAVRKFGAEIGVSSRPIKAGEWVHSHNLLSTLAEAGLDYAPRAVAAPHGTAQSSARDGAPVFQGYLRADGRVGTRNEIWILNTVGCVNQAAQDIAREAAQRYAGRADGFHAFPHPYGCSQVGEDLAAMRRLLAGLIRNPNAGGVLVLGLGCENNQLAELCAKAGVEQDARVRYFNAQDSGDEVEEGLAEVADLLDEMSADRRAPVPLSSLVLGVKCGGSDGFSSVTANPLVGRVSDRVTAAGGYVLLGEVPEMFGAERILLERAVDDNVHSDCLELFADFRAYFRAQGVAIDENPSPGNIAGGITTLQEKSLGAVQKGGTRSPVTGVLRYGQRVSRPGLSLLETPGNDAVSSTALAASGATVILFTTGRGTPLGFPVPTIKIASNSDLARRKPHWIDFDAGACLAPGCSVEEQAEALMNLTLAVASGEQTRNELNDNREIAFWKRGVTL